MAILLVSLFLLGYLAITLETYLKLSKAIIAMITAFVLWGILLMGHPDAKIILDQLTPAIFETLKIVLFLLGAMCIVALMDIQGGFFPITKALSLIPKNRLVWAISILTFCLSAFLDNLTTAIVMVAIINKIVENTKSKWFLLGLVIIAANAGGAFSPIGDVTTTMLWMGGQITPLKIIKHTFLASFVSMVIPTVIIQIKLKGKLSLLAFDINETKTEFSSSHRSTIFYTGITCLLLIPFLKWYFNIPAYVGMIIGVGIMALITGLLWSITPTNKKELFPLGQLLNKIDIQSGLFFFAILLSVAALDAANILPLMALKLNNSVGDNLNLVAIGIGLFSAVVDNIPLIAALQHMYPLTTYPTDHYFWELLAYTAGTGGSCLLIGSAAGVAVMGLEKMDFFWYLKNISWIALAGFFTGAIIYVITS